MSDAEVLTRRFDAETASGRAARRFVADQLDQWGLDDLHETAALVTAELAANAVLHTRRPFAVSVRRTTGGVRIDVMDAVPHQVPVEAPTEGTAADLLHAGTTGRGLHIVSAFATRWGAFTAGDAKTVWAELDVSGPPPTPATPEVHEGTRDPSANGPILLCYMSLPVRTAVASGIQLDETVRTVQLGLGRAASITSDERGRLFSLLDRSAPVRLAGRHGAYDAAAAGRRRYDLELRASEESLKAVGELSVLMAELSDRLGVVTRVSPSVARLRHWLNEEADHQRAGGEPRMCALPDDLPRR